MLERGFAPVILNILHSHIVQRCATHINIYVVLLVMCVSRITEMVIEVQKWPHLRSFTGGGEQKV